MKEYQAKAQNYFNLHKKVQKLRKIMELSGREFENAENSLDDARKILGETVGSNVRDRLFRLEGGDYVDVQYKDTGGSRNFTVTVRESEPTE